MDQESMYEKFLGIKTDDEEIVFHLDKNLKYSVYEASEYEGLISIFDYLNLLPTDTIVDYGCGLGRVLFYCNQRFGCKVTGVEYDSRIYEKLCENAECYYVRFKNQERKFSLLHMKAEDYIIEPTDNYFYMFNPFSNDVMQQIFNKIIDSYNSNPRKITIILYYCTYEQMKLVRNYPFSLEKILKLPAYRLDPDEKAYIFSLK